VAPHGTCGASAAPAGLDDRRLRFTRAFTTNFPNSQWLTVSDVLPMPTGFAHWKFVSLAVFTALIGLFPGGLTVAYDCKELE